jgi:hypothetical protein
MIEMHYSKPTLGVKVPLGEVKIISVKGIEYFSGLIR